MDDELEKALEVPKKEPVTPQYQDANSALGDITSLINESTKKLDSETLKKDSEILDKDSTPPSALHATRTMREDMTSAISKGNLSVGRNILSEARKEERGEVKDRRKKILTLLEILGVIFFLISGLILFLTVTYTSYFTENKEVEIRTTPTPLISVDEISTIDLSGESNMFFYRKLFSGTSTPMGKKIIKWNIPVENFSGNLSMIGTKDFFNKVGLLPSDRFFRVTGDSFLYGELGMGQDATTTRFIILEILGYQAAKTEMLSWEGTLLEEMWLILSTEKIPTVSRNEFNVPIWQDLNEESIEIRVLNNASNTPVMLYSFLGSKDKLLIAKDLETFREVRIRMLTPKPTTAR